jgi:hypothetical protein
MIRGNSDQFNSSKIDLNYVHTLNFILGEGEDFLYCWLKSETFQNDLKNLYTLNVPHIDEWQNLI